MENKFDFSLTNDGDIELDRLTCDTKLVDKDILLEQSAKKILKSITRDWFNADNFGANMEEFLGMDLDEKTCQTMISRITNSFVKELKISKEDLFFIPKIKDGNKIFITIFLRKQSESGVIQLEATLDLAGEVKLYEVSTQ